MKKSVVCFALLAVLGLSTSLVCQGETISTCEPSKSVSVGPYVVQTDYWNKTKCPGTQCVDIDGQTGSFTVTKSTPVCPDVSSYPSIVYGKGWGIHSAQSDLPAPLRSLQFVTSSWAFTPSYTGSWDAAYDIWICPDNQCGPSGFNGGAEVMIWLDYLNTFPGPNKTATVALSGTDWDIYQTDMNAPGQSWKYIAYTAKAPVTAVNNLAINDFLKDSISRGYVKPDGYLYAVEAGNEMRKDGVPFTSQSFSVSINQGAAAKTTYMNSTHPPTPIASPVKFLDTVPTPPTVNGKGLIIQDFSSDDPKAGGTFADSNGSSIAYFTKDNAGKPGAKFLVINYDEKPGGYCGMFYHTGSDWNGQDWSGGKAIDMRIYSKVPVAMGFAFKDKNNNQYTADGPSTKGTGWETIQIPLASFVLDRYYTPPDAVKGASLDLSSVKSFNLQPKTGIQTTVAIDSLRVVQ